LSPAAAAKTAEKAAPRAGSLAIACLPPLLSCLAGAKPPPLKESGAGEERAAARRAPRRTEGRVPQARSARQVGATEARTDIISERERVRGGQASVDWWKSCGACDDLHVYGAYFKYWQRNMQHSAAGGCYRRSSTSWKHTRRCRPVLVIATSTLPAALASARYYTPVHISICT